MVVVIGAGIAGASTAFYLCQNHHQDVTIIDAVGPATCSKAAAFLSESWGDRTKTEKLHRKSFQLHLDLAEELGLDSFWQVPAYYYEHSSVDDDDSEDTNISTDNEVPLSPWNSNSLDDHPKQPARQKPGRHALVDPEELVTSLVDAAKANGAKVEINTVAGLEVDEDGVVARRIVFDNGQTKELGEEEPVVVAMGPWTSRIEDWLQLPMPMDGVLSTSLVWEELQVLDAPSALFCEEDIHGCHLEVFQRGDNSVYVSGLGNSKPMKASLFRGPHRPMPGNEVPSRPDAALRSLEDFHLIHRDRSPDDVRACIRPMSPDGMPVVGQVGDGNVYVASGGGPWGITWGPLLGLILANKICGKEPPLSPASAVNPARFDSFIQRTLMERRQKEAWS